MSYRELVNWLSSNLGWLTACIVVGLFALFARSYDMRELASVKLEIVILRNRFELLEIKHVELERAIKKEGDRLWQNQNLSEQ